MNSSLLIYALTKNCYCGLIFKRCIWAGILHSTNRKGGQVQGYSMLHHTTREDILSFNQTHPGSGAIRESLAGGTPLDSRELGRGGPLGLEGDWQGGPSWTPGSLAGGARWTPGSLAEGPFWTRGSCNSRVPLQIMELSAIPNPPPLALMVTLPFTSFNTLPPDCPPLPAFRLTKVFVYL